MSLPHACVLLLLAAGSTFAQDPPRAARVILREYDRVVMPSMSDGVDADSVRRFRRAIEEGCRRKADLAAELQRGHPDHPRLPEVLAIRWASLSNALGEADTVLRELEPLLADQALRDDVRTEARRALARACIASDRCDLAARITAVTDLVEHDDEPGFASSCLLDLFEERAADPGLQRRLLQIAVAKWPNDPYGGRPAKRWLKMLDMTGRPFAEQLPAELREWFRAETADEAEFTVVQVWMGHVDASGDNPELDALQALLEENGARVRLLGLINGDVEEKRPALVKAGIDWPQAPIADPAPMESPFGAPKTGFYFVLDGRCRVAGVVGNARLLAERIALLREAAVR